MKNAFLFAIALVMSAFMAVAVQAATLTNVSGDVKINRGNGYQQVTTQRTVVNPGDKIIVGPNANASLIYPNGQVVSLGSGVTTVSAAAPAAAGGLLGGGLGGLGTAGLVAGGLAIAGGVVLLVTDDKKSSP